MALETRSKPRQFAYFLLALIALLAFVDFLAGHGF
jgi:hypothetical protein